MQQSNSSKDFDLATLCEVAFQKAEEVSWSGETGSRDVTLVWVYINEERELYNRIIHEDDWAGELLDTLLQAKRDGLKTKITWVVEPIEVFADQTIADNAGKEIESIHKQWKRKNFTPSSAVKLVLAHFNMASAMLKQDVCVSVKRNATVNVDELEDAVTGIEESETVPLMTSIIRARVKDLSMMVGSPDNLISYIDALKLYASDCSRARPKKVELSDGTSYRPSSRSVRDDCYTVGCKNSIPKVQWKHWRDLMKYLMGSLGQEVVRIYGEERADGSRPSFLTCISPAEMAEVIGLKIALGVRHQAMNIEEVSEMEKHLKVLAAATQKLCVMPETGYDNDEEDDQEALGVAFYSNGKVVEPMGYLTPEHTKTWVKEEVVDVVVAEVGKVKTSKKVKIKPYSIGRWVKTFKTPDGRTMYDWVSQTINEKTVVKSSHVVDVKPIIKQVVKTTVETNVRSLPRDEWVRKDWDLFFSVRSPEMFRDARYPRGEDGKFPKKYYGPSFVHIGVGEDGKPMPVKAGKCMMHDGRLWKEWSEGGEEGQQPTCPHCHIQKVMLNPTTWEPKVDIVREFLDESGRTFEHTTTMLADRKHMSLVWNDNGFGTMKPSLAFDYPGMRMSLLTSAFKRHVKECVWAGDFMAAPILDETFKPGILMGEDAAKMKQLMDDIDLFTDTSHPDLFKRIEEAKGLEAKKHGWDIRKSVLHVFVPMNLDLFNIDDKLMPSGFRNMAIRVQLTGLRSHLVRLMKEHNGEHLVSSYTENDAREWILRSSHVNGVRTY